jgi:glycosyltransferase involved in cell wall biosynthesis
MGASEDILPRWFDAASPIAGALHEIDPIHGLVGWVLDKSDAGRRFSLDIVVRSHVIARGRTRLLRGDLAEAVGEAPRCGFRIEWKAFDAQLVRSCLSSYANAEFEVIVPELGKRLPRFSTSRDLESLKLGDLYAYLKGNGVTPETRAASRDAAMQLFFASGAPAIATPEIQLDRLEQLGVEAFLPSSGLFDPGYYASQIGGELSDPDTLVRHYLAKGEDLGLKPNPYFDPGWRRRKYPGDPRAGGLLHYVLAGERAGQKPCALFEPGWYAESYGLDLSRESALAHYLRHRAKNLFNPNRHFDIAHYLEHNPDIRAAPIDGFEHWFGWGQFEGRSGSPAFSADYVRRRYLGGKRELNAFEMFMDLGQELGWEPAPGAAERSLHARIAENCAPGPLFEDKRPLTRRPADAPQVVAFYLTQFHAIAENDAWWGPGFTEWRNLPRGLPRYAGHVQPRIPRDLGFYTLDGSAMLRRQAEMARAFGLTGFCFYYYNFNGHRLLERPLEAFLADKDIDFSFCLMWANENWSRRWDGSDSEILMRQDYREADMPALVADLARHMQDPRYMRTPEGRPLFFLYRADVVPDPEATIRAWKRQFREAHGLDPVIAMAQAFDCEDPREFGFDGAVEFPPHKLGGWLPNINHQVEMLDPDFTGAIRAYSGVVEESRKAMVNDFPLIKTAFPNWDNDARRQGKGMSFAGSTPKAFRDWMADLLANARAQKFFGLPLVFVNAWNEWCEGAYLEPDVHFGYAYINALARALEQLAGEGVRRLVLIGHDAFPSGAQQLLLNIGRTFRRDFGLETEFVLIGGGAMAERYRAAAPTLVGDEHDDVWAAIAAHLRALRQRGFRHALTNTVVSGGVAPVLDDLGYRYASLIHELPTLVASCDHESSYRKILAGARPAIYPNHFVKDRLDAAFGPAVHGANVRPQGLYNRPNRAGGGALRARLGLRPDDRLIVNIGHADLRKGVDLFIAIADQTARIADNVHFLWLGSIHPELEPWLKLDIAGRGLKTLHFHPFDPDVGAFLDAADLFLLTSREDPFPSVVLEALSVGLPVAAFEHSGGHAELIASDPRLGVLLPFADVKESAERLPRVLRDERLFSAQAADFRRGFIAGGFDFRDYCVDLLRLLEPSHRTVSVIVPNYNYARYLEQRLTSIFRQTHPVLEIIVLDDASADDSLQVAEAAAKAADRAIRLVPRAANSGNVFRQWKAGLDLAQGEFVWIAEADDSSDPAFLAEMIERLSGEPKAGLCFCDSRAIGPDGDLIYADYKGYYREFGDTGLDADGCFAAQDFLRRFLVTRNLILNASAVVWRRDALSDVFQRLGDEAFALKCAGDWRIYLEACALGRPVLYSSQTLNHHRRHDGSVTHALRREAHYREIVSVQDRALALVEAPADLRDSIKRFREGLRETWDLQ